MTKDEALSPEPTVYPLWLVSLWSHERLPRFVPVHVGAALGDRSGLIVSSCAQPRLATGRLTFNNLFASGKKPRQTHTDTYSYMYIYLYLDLYLYLYIYLSLSLSLYLPISLSLYLSVYLSLSLYLPT